MTEMIIEVERKDKKDEFDIKSLKYFHQNCGGGAVEFTERSNHHYYILFCRRCESYDAFLKENDIQVGIINTAINGAEYTINGHSEKIRFVPRPVE